MTHPTTTTPPAAAAIPWGAAARWMATLVAFPLGSVAARLAVGSIDHSTAALVGGAINGAILGTAQAWALGDRRPRAVPWVAGTSAGLAVGLAVGARVVEYATDARSLIIQGAFSGAAVALAQAAVLARAGYRSLPLLWPLLLTVAWALGWAVTTAVGVEVDRRFTVFGSSGALVVTALTLVLPVLAQRRARGVRS